MGQVPATPPNSSPLQASPRYLLIGSGRLARHLKHYLQKIGLPLELWSRNSDPEFNTESPDYFPEAQERLERTAQYCNVFLLAVSDSALNEVYERLSPHAPSEARWVHFSGAYSDARFFGLHPLMTFGLELFDMEIYQRIPLIGDRSKEEFHAVFPQLENPYHVLAPDQRPLYHALCVMGGNFTHLLWWMVERAFREQLQLSPEVLHLYKAQVFAGALKDPERALTGPFVRGDWATVEAHLQCLSPQQLRLYQEFFELFHALTESKSSQPFPGETHEHRSL